jgi:hypothetical protein
MKKSLQTSIVVYTGAIRETLKETIVVRDLPPPRNCPRSIRVTK